MIKIEHMEAFNFDGAIRGMRNPMNSWDKSDSNFEYGVSLLGPKDLELAKLLVLAGSDHSKFARQIFVSMDITAPIYWWKEMSTYKVATVANSTSTMHKLTSKQITSDDFSFDNKDLIIHPLGNDNLTFDDVLENVIYDCERLRELYIETKDPRYWRALIQLLPESYNQTRTWTANYAILRNIYFARRHHKLDEWHTFCEAIKELPYSKELIFIEKENNNETNQKNRRIRRRHRRTGNPSHSKIQRGRRKQWVRARCQRIYI